VEIFCQAFRAFGMEIEKGALGWLRAFSYFPNAMPGGV